MNKKIKLAALADIHVGRLSQKPFTELFAEISEKADVLLLCGDLTDRGLPNEAEMLAKQIESLTIPAVGVLGNHDYENGKQNEVQEILMHAKMYVLKDEPVELLGIGFAGAKGFGGGFDKHMLAPFGEDGVKNFVTEATREVYRLENQLSQLETQKKIVLLHYSPIKETLAGEPVEIFPFLGSSRLMEPIETYDVNAVFHGHAHYGTHAGKTTNKKIPVYNVSFLIMQKLYPKSPYAIVEL